MKDKDFNILEEIKRSLEKEGFEVDIYFLDEDELEVANDELEEEDV